MCLAGVAQAQVVEGSINGTAKAGATVTLTGPGGKSAQAKALPNGTFSFGNVPAGTYTLTSDGVTREIVVVAGADSRVELDLSSLEKITVTGSRIQHDTFSSASPITVITRDETMLSGFSSTTAALQGTAVTGGGEQINNAFGGYVTDGGPGANTISLRGLGATRTLVLLNGKRLSPAGSRGSVGSADLNVLPTAIIDRIEVLKDGASSIYGSDAVAGVINVITKRNFSGLQLEAQYNWPEDGGGQETRAAATYGLVSNRGYFTGSFEVYDRKEITWGQRDWTRCQTDYRRAASGGAWGSGDFIDPATGQPKCYTISGTGNNGVTINTLGTASMAGVGAPGSVGTVFNRWRPNANVTTGLVGYEGVGGGANNVNVRDTFDPRMLNNSLISPGRTATAFLQGGFDTGILGNAEAYFEGLFTERKSHQIGYRQLSLDYEAGSPLIPADLAALPGNAATGGSLVTSNGAYKYRAFIGAGNYESEQTVDFGRVLAGLRGDLPLADWRYDTNVSFARSKAKYGYENWLTDRVKKSLDVVSVDGVISCRDASDGCVPAPALTPATIGGNLPQAWTDYTWANVVGVTKYDEATYNFGANGPLFEIPHGTVRGAFGIEYRWAKINDTPSIDMQNANVYNFSSAGITRGTDAVWEAYGEVEFPLLRNLPAAEELTVNVSGRWTDYRSYGSDKTWKLGALWTPIKPVSVRGAIGTSYRAPALFEQYVGGTTGYLSSTGDPCNNYGASTNDNRRANCALQGLPDTFQQNQSIESVTIGGKDAGLKAETSKNKTFGIIFQPALPKSVGDISLAVDYYDIQVNNGVDRIGTSNILSLCYDSVAMGSAYCRLITRDPDNGRLSVNNSYVNVSTDRVRGFDYTARYVRGLGAGTFRLNAVMTRYVKQENKLFPDDPFESINGHIGSPKKTGTLDAAYLWRGFTFRYGLDWVGKMSMYGYYEEDPETSTYKMDTPDYIVHSFSTQYKVDKKWAVTAGVRNFTNKSLPQISQGFDNRVGNAPLYSGYDYVGRTWFMSGTYSF